MQQTLIDRDGYVAPPLDGIWAIAPYLHNATVPPLCHLMNVDNRPAVTIDQQSGGRLPSPMDEDKVGLTIEQASDISASNNDRVFGRSYPDTRKFWKERRWSQISGCAVRIRKSGSAGVPEDIVMRCIFNLTLWPVD